MVADIHPTSDSAPSYIVASGTRLYFQAENDSTYGKELWAYEETNDTAWMIDDLNPGGGDSNPRNIIVSGSRLYFSAQDGTNGYEVWIYEETNDTAWMITDDDGVNPSYPPYFGVLGTRIFFDYSATWTNQPELWSYEETNDTAWRIAITNQVIAYVSKMIVLDNKVYFKANDGVVGPELWAYDPAGVTVSGQNSGPNNGPVTNATCEISPSLPTGLTLTQGTCTISGTPTITQSTTTYTLWVNDSGFSYSAIVDITIESGDPVISPASTTVTLTNNTAMTPITYNWVGGSANSTGTYNGNGTTWQVTGFSIGIISDTTALGTQVFFNANDGTNGQELWTFDTTNNLAWMVDDINPSGSSNPSELVASGTRLYFNADDGTNHNQLWAHETTNNSTWMITNISIGSIDLNPEDITVMGTRLYFSGKCTLSLGYELCAYETTNDTTWMVEDIRSGVQGSLQTGGAVNNGFIVLDTQLFFSADDGTNKGLWTHETSNGSTWMIDDYYHLPESLSIIGTRLFYQGNDGTNGRELWAYETTNDTTWMAADIHLSGHSAPTDLTVLGTQLYFNADDGTNGVMLWVHETTNGSTWKVIEFSISSCCTVLGTRLFFSMNSVNSGTPAIHAYESTNDTVWEIFDPVGGGFIHSTFALNSQIYIYSKSHQYLWTHDPVNITDLSGLSNGPVTNATCEISPTLPTGITLTQGTCTISGTPSVTQSATTYTLWVNDSGVSNSVIVTITIDEINTLTASVEGAALNLGEAMTPITLNYTLNTPPPVSWETDPALPAGMSISNGVISGTPSVYANNQTYTIYANQSGYSTTHELWFSVDSENPHTVVDGQAIDAIGFHPPFNNGTTSWGVTPALPANLTMDASTGEITGSVNGTLANTTYSVTATHSGGATEPFSFNLQSLADYDGDGLPNQLPGDYNTAEPPTPGLVADSDDDGDGLADTIETDTGTYIDATNTGTDPLDPDTDDDGICDGPNAVLPICIAGPDGSPNGDVPPPILVGVNNTAITTLDPYMAISGGTYEIAPDLPLTLTLNPSTGEISGTPTEALANTTFTVWVNHSDGTSLSWNFTVEILEDSDGDGLPNELPGDYDSSNPDSPGLVEDTDDDNDGISDIDEQNDGTNPLHPDTDGDGMCDGEIPSTYFDPNCVAGPDAFPTDPSGDTDTDGDGDPDVLTPPSNSDPALVEDLDDDGDGLEDVNETNTGINNGNTDTGTDPLDPDTDDDGICDGPNAVPPICVAGPDMTPFGEEAEGMFYGLNNTAFSSIVPPYQLPDAVWEISPTLPLGMDIDSVSGIISGTPLETFANTTFTMYGNASTSSSTVSFGFDLQILEDTDRDGEPNELPIDYPVDGTLTEDLDDDGDGASDLNETGTGIYNGTNDMGTDPLDPDTDDDGICDGPNDVLPICVGGPDSNPFGTGPLGPTVLLNNSVVTSLLPANAVPGATWEISPDLPEGLDLDASTGIITGTPTQVLTNTTFTLWANTTTPSMSIVSTFWLEVLEDSDGDGMPDTLPEDYPDTNPPYDLVEDLDDDNDGMSDEDENTIGTEPTDPDTDGDGFCDGNGTGDGACYAGPDSAPLDPLLPVNTDGDGFPDDDPDGEGGLVADTDDDNDGFLDTREIECLTDPLNATDMPQDLDADGICDGMDDDVDGDGLLNSIEKNTGVYNSTTDTGTDPRNADTDGDGVCDGPSVPLTGGCTAGPDAFPLDPAAYNDTDSDGYPDNLYGNSTSTPPLELDLDDDNDDWSDLDEVACSTDTLDDTSIPADTDGDGVCDALDDILDLPFNLTYPRQILSLNVNQEMAAFHPNITGLGEVATWEISGDLPEGLTFGWSPARDALLDGSIRGTPVNVTETMNFTIWANNSAHSQSYNISLTVADAVEQINEDDEFEFTWMWCFPCLILLLLILLIPLTLGRDKLLLLLADGPEPKNTSSSPEFISGSGTLEDPFVLKPIVDLAPGESANSIEVITIDNMSDIKVGMVDLNQESNGNKFCMFEVPFEDSSSLIIDVGKDREIIINMKFDDDKDTPTFEGGEFTGLLKLGRASVYFSWSVKVKKDLSIKKKYEKAAKKAAKAAEEKDAKADKAAEEKDVEADKAEKKAAEEMDAKADKAKAESDTVAKPVSKEEKKKDDLKRIKSNADTIDFVTIGIASASERDNFQRMKGIGPFIEEKLNALGIFTFRQISNMTPEIEDQVNIAIEFFGGRIKRDKWVNQAKELLKED
jgi:ELWxxDGT repeat protein